MQEMMLMKDMTDSQRLVFQSQMNRERKNPTTALLLTLFLGGLGAHRFYMGETGTGIVYALFVWTFIPALVAFVELFTITNRVETYNQNKAMEIASQVRVAVN